MMTQVVALSLFIDLLKFFGAVTAAWGILQILDRLAAHHFSDSLRILQANPIGLGIYLGLRFFGVCTIAARFVG